MEVNSHDASVVIHKSELTDAPVRSGWHRPQSVRRALRSRWPPQDGLKAIRMVIPRMAVTSEHESWNYHSTSFYIRPENANGFACFAALAAPVGTGATHLSIRAAVTSL
jgi:hypothetical protein